MKDLINEYIFYNKRKNTKLSIRILDYMDRDIISSIIVDGYIFWIERFVSIPIPMYVRKDIEKYMNKLGYRYLFN